MKLTIFLPFPPTVNSYYVKTRNGVFISQKGKGYTKAVSSILREQLPPEFTTLDSSIRLTVVLNPPDKRVRDLDNYMKALLDSLKKAELWVDDSLIDQLFIYRGEVLAKDGRCVLIVDDEASPTISGRLLTMLIDGELD